MVIIVKEDIRNAEIFLMGERTIEIVDGDGTTNYPATY
jgi:hypothetical protein